MAIIAPLAVTKGSTCAVGQGMGRAISFTCGPYKISSLRLYPSAGNRAAAVKRPPYNFRSPFNQMRGRKPLALQNNSGHSLQNNSGRFTAFILARIFR